jgi:hypothetical protein
VGTAVANVVIKVAGKLSNNWRRFNRNYCLFGIGDKANLEQLDKLAPAFEKPKITKNSKQKSIQIECRCKGKQEPKITWKKNKLDIKDTPNKYKISKTKEADDTYVFTLDILVSSYQKKIITRDLLSPIQNATPTDGGIYKILAKNDAGDSQALVNLTIDPDAAPP